jgi:hypothetical protein
VDAVYGNTLWVDFEGKPIRTQKEIGFSRFIFLYTYNYIPGMSMFWRRTIYDKAGGLNPEYQLAFDADLWMRISDVGGKIRHVRRQWSRMRRYTEQKTMQFQDVVIREDMQVRSRYWKNRTMPSTYALRRKIAMSIRVLWKLVTGCYGRGYMRDIGNA